MISKAQIKNIKALSLKKFRDEKGLFVAEGTKLVLDLIPAFEMDAIYATQQWLSENKVKPKVAVQIVTQEDMFRMSTQKSPQGVLAVFKKRLPAFTEADLKERLSLALDEIQDPGNLGTIIRIADWFGVRDVFCSMNCADAYAPKTVQATMGALARVNVHYVELENFLQQLSPEMPVYGTFMDGENIYKETLSSNGIIVMGNEGNGISPKIEKLVTKKLLIPNFPEGQPTSESLNVGVATAITCAEFRRAQQAKLS